MENRCVYLFMVVMVAITSLQPTSIGAQMQSRSIDDEYAVYSALIRTKYVKDSRKLVLVYVEHGCGATCGQGGYVLLKKEGEVWKVQKEVMFMAA